MNTKTWSYIIGFIVLCMISPVLAAVVVVAVICIRKTSANKKQRASAVPNQPRRQQTTATATATYRAAASSIEHQSDYSGLDRYLQEDIRQHNKRYKGMSNLLQ